MWSKNNNLAAIRSSIFKILEKVTVYITWKTCFVSALLWQISWKIKLGEFHIDQN